MDRRSFLKTATLGSAATAVALIELRLPRLARAAVPNAVQVAFLTDAHVCAPKVNRDYAARLRRAVADVRTFAHQPDVVIFGGDLTQHGQLDELELGATILEDLGAPVHMLVGEHDWYFDLGESWQKRFGAPHYSFDHGGVHFVALNSVQMRDFWSARSLSPIERVLTAGGIDNGIDGTFRLGAEQLTWLSDDLAGYSSDVPLVLLSHAPLHAYYAPWGFSLEDAQVLDDLLLRFESVVVLHGHTHQPHLHEHGRVRSYGMPATAWPWPYPPGSAPPSGLTSTRHICGSGILSIDLAGDSETSLNLWGRGALQLRPA